MFSVPVPPVHSADLAFLRRHTCGVVWVSLGALLALPKLNVPLFHGKCRWCGAVVEPALSRRTSGSPAIVDETTGLYRSGPNAL